MEKEKALEMIRDSLEKDLSKESIDSLKNLGVYKYSKFQWIRIKFYKHFNMNRMLQKLIMKKILKIRNS